MTADLDRPVALALLWARVQGAVLDLLTGTAAGLAAGLVSRRPRLGVALGLLAGAAVSLRWTRMRAARAIERRRPALGSAVEALLEGQGGRLRPSLSRWVSERIGPVFLRASALRAAVAIVCVPIAATLPSRLSVPAPAPAKVSPAHIEVRIHVEPPAYSGRPASDIDGTTAAALRGSRLRLRISIAAPSVLVSEAGHAERRLPVASGDATLELELDHSRALRVSTDERGPVSLVNLEAVPDRPPEVTLIEPLADRTVTAPPRAFALKATARDDLGVKELTLRWTLAQGRGEGMKFRNGRLRAQPVEKDGGMEVSGQLDPVAVGMKQGDTLVVWGEAADGNTIDGPGRSRSEARILKWDEPVVELRGLHGGAPLPPPSSLLTEREILARTERLVGKRLRGKALREQSLDLADDQRKLRTSFGFFLQAESGGSTALDVDDKEVAESGDARARRRLADAVSFMWEAESALSIGNPGAAIPAERSAVKALDDAFGLVRMSLRPPVPPDKPVDESRRLRGDQRGLRPAPGSMPAGPSPERARIAALARELLLGSQQGVSAEMARTLGDRLWTLSSPELPATTLAAGLYAAADGGARSARAREAGEMLARWLHPSPVAVPPRGAEESELLARVPAAAR